MQRIYKYALHLKPRDWLILALTALIGVIGTVAISNKLEKNAVQVWIQQGELDAAIATGVAQSWLAQSETIIQGLAMGVTPKDLATPETFVDTIDNANNWNSEFSLSAVATVTRITREDRANFETLTGSPVVHALSGAPSEDGLEHMIVTRSTETDGILRPNVDLLTHPQIRTVVSTVRTLSNTVMMTPVFTSPDGRISTLVGTRVRNSSSGQIIVGLVDISEMIEFLVQSQVPAGMRLRLSERETESSDTTKLRAIYGSLEPGPDVRHTVTVRVARGQARWNYHWDVLESYRGGAPTANSNIVQIGGLLITVLIVYTIGFVSIQRVIVQGVVKEKTSDLNEMVQRAERVSRAKSSFLANMSHELRTPLNAIVGYAQVLNKQLFGDLGSDKNREYVDVIMNAGMYLSELLGGMLDISKIEAGEDSVEREWIDVSEFVEECRDLMAEDISNAGLDFSSDIAATANFANADRLKTKQCVLNLISNSVKFTEQGGAITLSAYADDDNAFCLKVTDTGIGMSEEELEIAIEPFGQAGDALTRRQGGTGLGLYLVKTLAELHDGRVSLQSESGVGTTVILSFGPDSAAVKKPE